MENWNKGTTTATAHVFCSHCGTDGKASAAQRWIAGTEDTPEAVAALRRDAVAAATADAMLRLVAVMAKHQRCHRGLGVEVATEEREGWH